METPPTLRWHLPSSYLHLTLALVLLIATLIATTITADLGSSLRAAAGDRPRVGPGGQEDGGAAGPAGTAAGRGAEGLRSVLPAHGGRARLLVSREEENK